jgi:VWFA-related protein
MGQGKTIIFLTVLATLLLFGVNVTAQTPEPDETIRVDSDLVDLQVSVLSLNAQTPVGLLQEKDFMVLEDGQPQKIEFFAAADAPFDLVLLLDLSGSTADKLKLIRKSAKRFVDATRPIDRVAILTFTDVTLLVSGFTQDRVQLKKMIDHIEKPEGGTRFWDSLKYILDSIARRGHSSRRTAIVVMSVGVDNALPDIFGDGSATTFEQLMRVLERSDAIVVPIYLDTEMEALKRQRVPGPVKEYERAQRAAYETARNQLQTIADACGTKVYKASKVEDLETVYEHVIRDLGTVYSIGYSPANKAEDGKWRSVTVQLNGRQDLYARAKRGYYSRQALPQ